MLDILLEQPLTIAIVGTAMVVVAGFVWVQNAHKAALYAAIGLAALTIILVFVSLQVVTHRERIKSILYEVATALQANDHEKAISYIHPNAVEASSRARAELPRLTFTEARITGIKRIVVNANSKPPTAIAEFFVRVGGNFPGYGSGEGGRFLRVDFMLRDGRWLVREYAHFDIQVGFTNSPMTTLPPGAY